MTQILFLDKNPRGRHALRHLGAPPDSGSAEDPDLVIDATAAQVVDAFTGAVTMADIEDHLGKPGPGRGVTVTPPEGGEVHGRFYTMMALAPQEGCRVEHSGPTAPVRDPRVLLPAVRVGTVAEADALALFLRASSQRADLGDARLAPRQAGLLAAALPDLVDNGLRHAPASGCGVIVCAALESDSREVQLVVTDLGPAISGPPALEALRDAWGRSRAELGSLHFLTERASRLGLDISVQIRTGNAHGRWRRRWHSDDADFTPGWTVCVTIHR
jgi:hypothetical protein